MDWGFCQGFHASTVLPEGVFNHAIIKTGNHHVVPRVPDAPQSHIKHRHDLSTQRFMTVERDVPKKLLAFRISGIMSSRIWLLPFQINRSANSARNFVRSLSKKIDQSFFLQPGWQSLARDFSVPLIACVIGFLDQVKPKSLFGRSLRGGVDGNHGSADARS